MTGEHRTGSGGPGVTPADWEPEIRIGFDRWFELRLTAEAQLAELGGTPIDFVEFLSIVFIVVVVLKDRGRAPNLAAVREMSMGVWNGGSTVSTGEIWVNEPRIRDRIPETQLVDPDLPSA